MFDRTTWIAIALSVAGLVGWQYYYSKTYAPYIAQQAALHKEAKQKEAVAKPSPSPSATPQSLAKSALLPATAGSTPSIPDLSPKRETLDTSRAEYLFANNTGGIEAVTLFLHLGANEQSLFLNKESGMPIGALCDGNGTPIGGFAMNADKNQGATSFSRDPRGIPDRPRPFFQKQRCHSPCPPRLLRCGGWRGPRPHSGSSHLHLL